MDKGISLNKCIEGRLYVFFQNGKPANLGYFIKLSDQHDQLHGDFIAKRLEICPVKSSGNQCSYRISVPVEGNIRALEVQIQ